jgi:opacity protein-like surface antigen
MKKIMTAIFASIFVLATASAYANQYVGVHLGTDFGHNTNNTVSGDKVGFKTGVTYGYVLGSGFRVEFEGSYRQTPFKSTYVTNNDTKQEVKTTRNINSISYLGNAYFDINSLNTYNVTPYIGVGMGYSQHSDTNKQIALGKSNKKTIHENGFVYQGIVGLKFPISDTLDLMTQYHYFVGRAHTKHHSVNFSIAKLF